MSELDKYFEKARNVEPIYEEDDAKKLLYGKLSDGGIATNLYNKIKVFPMITAIITSVATIATIAFFSLSSPEVRVEQPNTQKYTSASSVNSTSDTEELKEKKIITRSIIANHNIVGENETAKTKEKAESKTWTDDNKIDIKSVNSLKLTKDELAKLGIVIDSKSFKVNAFDKYTYTINQNNEKQRDYYDKDDDHDALPTPAMVTTSTGFKTLTLFKKGNVEATVDRYTDTKNGYSKHTTNIEQSNKADSDIDKTANLFYNPKLRDSLQSAADNAFKKPRNGNSKRIELSEEMERAIDSTLKNSSKEVDPELLKRLQGNPYMRDLLLRENDDVNVIMLNSYETTDNGGKVNVISDRNVKIYSTDLDLKDINTVIEASLDSLSNKNTTLVEVSELDSPSSNNPNNRTIFLPLESLGEGKKLKIMEGIATDINGNVIDMNGKVITEKYEESENTNYTQSNEDNSTLENKKYEIKLDGKTFSIGYDKLITDGKLDQNKYKEFMLGIGKVLGKDIKVDSELSGTSNKKIEKYELRVKTDFEVDSLDKLSFDDPNSTTFEIPLNTKLIIEDGGTDLEFKLRPGQTVWGEEKPVGSNKMFHSNMEFDFMKYNINELIPIEISFDGVNTDFIVWYEATDDFLKSLPTNILEKINPELVALYEQNDHCENEPIEKKDAVMDVWSGCSGAIKEMKVFPNPATSNSNVEFELEDSRVISISIYDLSGKLIKNVKTGMSLGKGNTSESLNLTGVNPGLYYVVVKSEKGEQALQRIIIE